MSLLLLPLLPRENSMLHPRDLCDVCPDALSHTSAASDVTVPDPLKSLTKSTVQCPRPHKPKSSAPPRIASSPLPTQRCWTPLSSDDGNADSSCPLTAPLPPLQEPSLLYRRSLPVLGSRIPSPPRPRPFCSHSAKKREFNNPPPAPTLAWLLLSLLVLCDVNEAKLLFEWFTAQGGGAAAGM